MYPKYLNGDTNIELAAGHQGYGVYVDKTSVTCLIYNPPYYRLAANIITNDYNNGRNRVSSTRTLYFDYYYDSHVIYGINIENNKTYGPYTEDDLNSTGARMDYKMAKIIWKTAYNMDWKW